MHNGTRAGVTGLHKSVIHLVVSVSGTPGTVLEYNMRLDKAPFHRGSGRRNGTPLGSGLEGPDWPWKFLEKSIPNWCSLVSQFHKRDTLPQKVSTQIYLERGVKQI